jgi:hypothetical protein
MKVAVCPMLTVWLAGGPVIDGGVFTVTVTGILVLVDTKLVIRTSNVVPLSEAVAARVV